MRDIHLGPTDFRLLEYLGIAGAGVLARATLGDRRGEIDERTVDVHVGRLAKRDPIRTIRGAGYAVDETFGKT
jgi:two-component system phosphate regulon response regulator PhoB